MPRKPRQASSTGIYHWITRGINRRTLFHFRDDHLQFLVLAKTHALEHGISIYHYCLMSNHVHMLIHAESVGDVSVFSHFVKRKYAYYLSKAEKRQGASFERMYKSIPIEDDAYLLECARYIERNPLRANLASNLTEYQYSSYSFYAHGYPNDIVTASPGYLGLSEDPQERRRLYIDYVSQHRPQDEYAKSDLLGV